MKKEILTLLFVSFLSSLALASEVPQCSSSQVRLSLKPIYCLRADAPDGIFDIPEVGLDIDDIQAIFDGAESSGGHGISPMNSPSPTSRRQALPIQGTLHCRASLLTDGGKRVSFLSFFEDSVSTQNPGFNITNLDWRHGLIDQADQWVGVSVAPSVGVENYSLKVFVENNQLVLSACLGKRGEEQNCANSLFDSNLQGSISTETLSQKPFVYRKLSVSCQIR